MISIGLDRQRTGTHRRPPLTFTVHAIKVGLFTGRVPRDCHYRARGLSACECIQAHPNNDIIRKDKHTIASDEKDLRKSQAGESFGG